MKRGVLILFAGILVAIVGFCGAYWGRTAPERAILESECPELLWLKHEFKLSDQEFDRICKLHEAYRPGCAEMCGRVAAKNAEITNLLATTRELTPEIDRKLGEAAEIRLQCQKRMLAHFMAVSREMPPEQGRRYLSWVQGSTLLSDMGCQHH